MNNQLNTEEKSICSLCFGSSKWKKTPRQRRKTIFWVKLNVDCASFSNKKQIISVFREIVVQLRVSRSVYQTNHGEHFVSIFDSPRTTYIENSGVVRSVHNKERIRQKKLIFCFSTQFNIITVDFVRIFYTQFFRLYHFRCCCILAFFVPATRRQKNINERETIIKKNTVCIQYMYIKQK